jgi:hypothetical protein
MATEKEGVRYNRVLQSFEDFQDCELVYGALEAARLLVQRLDPGNGALGLIERARAHRDQELRATYDDQAGGWRRNPG